MTYGNNWGPSLLNEIYLILWHRHRLHRAFNYKCPAECCFCLHDAREKEKTKC